LIYEDVHQYSSAPSPDRIRGKNVLNTSCTRKYRRKSVGYAIHIIPNFDILEVMKLKYLRPCHNLAVSRRPHTAETQIHFHDYPYGICGGKRLHGFPRVIRLALVSVTPPVLHTDFFITEAT